MAETVVSAINMDHEEPRIVTAEKPRWFKSPLASDRLRRPSESQPPPSPFKDSQHTSCHEYDYSGYPPLKRYEEPTLLEILYDLFFAANYNVFAQTQAVTDYRRFKSYVGYFSLLWGTWFIVTLYDVRYVTDSIFERIARAVQLGVLVGFTVVAPNFDPEDQDEFTMMTMSLMLFASRICLAIEYAHTLAQLFKYKRARRPFYIQIAINVISAAVYLGITFCFLGRPSCVFITWYVFIAAEAILSLVISNYWRTLSFTRTHLMKRLSLITVMILGESIQTVAQNIATIVKTPSAWNPYTIAMITSATATIYCVFLVYFDWMRHLQLPAFRQQIWTALHYPFHLSLVLFMQGYTQLILFVKAFNVFDNLTNALMPVTIPGNETSQSIANDLANASAQIFRLYPPQDSMVHVIVNSSIANISKIPDSTWAGLNHYWTSNETEPDEATLQGYATFAEQVMVIVSALANSIFSTFNIDVGTDVSLKKSRDSSPIKLAEEQITISDQTMQCSRLVFAYTYIACGCTLILLVMMALVSRMSPVGRLPRFRFIICILLGIGFAITSVLYLDTNKVGNFLNGPWPIPTILFGWLIVTVLVHIRGGSSGRSRSILDTARNVIGLFHPRRARERGPVRDNDDSQQGTIRFWPPTRENTDLSTADTLKEAISLSPKRRRVSFRDISPGSIPRPGSPHSIFTHAHSAHRKLDGSDQV